MIGRLALYILVLIPPSLFWVVYFIPPHSGENWFRVIAWFYIAPVCLFSVAAGLHLARKYGTSIFWWLLMAFCVSPLLWTFAELFLAFFSVIND